MSKYRPATLLRALDRTPVDEDIDQLGAFLTNGEAEVFKFYHQGVPETRAKLPGTKVVCARLARIRTFIDRLEKAVENHGFVTEDDEGKVKKHPHMEMLLNLYEREMRMLSRMGLLGSVSNVEVVKSNRVLQDIEDALTVENRPVVSGTAPEPPAAMTWTRPN